MKSIYQKLTLILVIAFILQIGLYTVFYNRVLVNRTISEINNQEAKRQEILQQGITIAQKYPNRPLRTQTALDQYSKKYNANFVLKDTEGNTILTTVNLGENIKNTIEKQGYIKSAGKVEYILYGYFPTHLTGIEPTIQQRRFRIFTILVVLGASFLTILFIYKTIADPLKKLTKAMNSINYGNTLIKIPYNSDDEFGMLCRNFEEMGRRLKKSEDNQQELIQAISHDLKTPLTSIIGYSKRLSEGKVSEDRKENYYATILRRSNELKSLLEELEDYSNVNVQNKYEKTNVNCYDYMEEVCTEIRPEVENKGGHFIYNLNIDKQVYISIDINKMKRVFTNIINNAIKYAGDQCTIEINSHTKDNLLTMEISDNGIGVPKEQLERIFDRFYRVDTSRSREKGGTGLGLSICSDIIKNLTGKIGAKDSNSGGLCIWIQFPCFYKTDHNI
jgi:signal transduction histidine kinase